MSKNLNLNLTRIIFFTSNVFRHTCIYFKFKSYFVYKGLLVTRLINWMSCFLSVGYKHKRAPAQSFTKNTKIRLLTVQLF